MHTGRVAHRGRRSKSAIAAAVFVPMRNKTKLILGALLVLSGFVIALWPHRPPSPIPMHSDKSASLPTTVDPASERFTPSTGKPLPVTVWKAPANPLKKVKDMTIREEEAMMAEIKKQDLPAIFQTMLDAERVEHDDLKQMHLQTVFSNALMDKKPTPEFLEQMYGFISNRANSEFERQLLIGALEAAASKESVDLLLRIANTAPDDQMRKSASTLAGIGGLGQDGPELLPMLERTWRETSNLTLIRSTASAMAKMGAPSGIELLVSAALATDDRDKVRQQTAFYALQGVYKGEAVPPLAARLADQPPTSEAVKLVAPVLARTNGPDGQTALVSWLQTRPENAAPLVHDLIRQQIRSDPFDSAWAKALEPGVAFKNEENRKAIREALDAYRAGRQRGP